MTRELFALEPHADYVVHGKENVTVRLQTTEGHSIGPVFGVCIMRATAEH